MTTIPKGNPIADGPSRRRVVAGAAVTVAVTVLGLAWAKWWPYTARVDGLVSSRTWTGSDLLRAGDVQAGDAPSWGAAVSFATAYLKSVWQALVVALLVAAAVQTLLPQRLVLRLLTAGGSVRQIAAATALGLPSMMCTCCTAPVARGLRLRGVAATAATAYWLANPMLNPAVLLFFCLTMPWQWTLTRFVGGVLLVVGASILVSRFDGQNPTTPPPDQLLPARAIPAAFLRTLARTAVVLIPEYIATVLIIGALRGWMVSIMADGIGTAGIIGMIGIVAAAVLGTLTVIPTGGELAIVPALCLTGLAAGPAGALLVTLPAVSLPGMIMVGRSLGWRTTALIAASSVVAGCLAGAFLIALS